MIKKKPNKKTKKRSKIDHEALHTAAHYHTDDLCNLECMPYQEDECKYVQAFKRGYLHAKGLLSDLEDAS